MKHKKYRPNIEGWNLVAVNRIMEGLERKIFDAIEETLRYAFEDDQTYIYFPIEWMAEEDGSTEGGDGIGGPQVNDPLTVYLRVGLDNGETNKPTYEFNLRKALRESIDTCAEDTSYYTGLGKLAASFRELADEIDQARKVGKENWSRRYGET